jgi:hypothetical protein
MGPKTSELVKELEDLALLLEQSGESHWRDWILEARSRILSSDYSGVERLLQAYGGMGSINDLILGQSTLGTLWEEDYVEVNKQLDKLRTKAWELANWIKRNHEFINP